MCECGRDKIQGLKEFEKKYRLADFFRENWEAYKSSPEKYIQPEQYKAVNSILICRTAALGIETYACPGCGEITEVYHSCKNRFCPTCSWHDTVRWAEKLKGEMMDLPHRHVVFTLPHGLNSLVKESGKYVLNILMRTSAETLKDWIGAKYGIKPGIISVLHTFGEKKDLHYHIHMIVTWGGIDPSNGTKVEIKGEYVNYEFLKKKFRCKIEDELIRLYRDGYIKDQFRDEQTLKRLLRRVNEKKWIVHFEPPMELASEVIRYIGRYSKRACLSEYKITKIEGENISFSYKDYKTVDNERRAIVRELTLHYREFFPRLLQHVPLPYFRMVRYYGIYSNRGEIPEQYRYKETEKKKEIGNEEEEWIGTKILHCTTCNLEKEYQYTTIEKKGDNKGEKLKMQYKRTIGFRRKSA